MKLSRGFVVPGVFLMCTLQAHSANARGPSTPGERTKVVALTRELEQNPLAENAAATRQWLRKWIIEVPDIRVYTCDDLLGHGLGDKYPYSSEINLQVVFSAAAFAIEHQDQARDEIAQYSAGVEGALRAYEVLLALKPDARSTFLDEFLAERKHGELADHVTKLANEKCKRANTDLIAALGGAGVGLVLALFVAWWFGGPRAGRVTSLSVTSRTATTFQWIVFSCALYYVTVLISLNFLEPEFDPRFRFVSEYVWGAYGWLMTTTFFVLGLAAFVVAWGLRDAHQSSRSARMGFGLLVVGALFVCLAGVFKDFLPHLMASAVAIPSVIMAALLVSWSFRQAPGWQKIYVTTLLIAIGMLAVFLSINVHIGPPGLLQRVFLFLFLLWLAIVVHRLVRVTAVT
jgi:hypothetical membrane protein